MFDWVKIFMYENFELGLRDNEVNFPKSRILRNHPTRTFSCIQLLRAAAEGNIEKVEYLLRNETNADAKRNTALRVTGNTTDCTMEEYEPSRTATPLHLSCLNGHLEVTQLLIENGADIKAEDEYGTTALHLASGNGQKRIVEFLIKSGANCNARNKYGVTPLHFAVAEDRLDVVQYLLLNGAYFNARTDRFKSRGVPSFHIDKWTPLMWAIENKYFDVMKILLQISISVESDYIDCLRIADAETFWVAVEFLISIDKHVNQIGLHELQQLLKLVIIKSGELGHRHIAMLELIIKRGVDINFKYETGKTALHLAVHFEQYDMIKILLKYDADVNSLDDSAFPPLHYSLRVTPTKVAYRYCYALLEHGCTRATTLDCIKLIACCPVSVRPVIEYHLLNYPEEEKPFALSDEFPLCSTFNGNISSSKWWDTCLFEIKKMKKKIYGQYSIYTVCVEKNLNRLASYTKNESLQSYCNSGACHIDYPIYRDVIRKKFNQGTCREELISKLDKLQIYSKAQNETEKVISMNRECWLKVAEYLSNPDLFSLIISSICELCSPLVTSTLF